jgi:hypothetical protein
MTSHRAAPQSAEESEECDYKSKLSEDGFVHIPGVFTLEECATIRRSAERIRRLSVGRHFGERYGNIRFFDGQEEADGRSLRSVIWCALLDADLEAVRRDQKLLSLLQPILGDSMRQVTNQLHYKAPGSRVSFPLHTDRSSRLRAQGSEIRNLTSCFYQTGIMVDPMSLHNGGVYFLPGSHKWSGETHYGQPAEMGRPPEADFQATMPEGCVPLNAQPGDVVIWSGDVVHGSALSQPDAGSRLFYINGYVRAQDCMRGYWAAINGAPVPLPDIDVPVTVYGQPEFEAFRLEEGRRLLEQYRRIE